MRLELYKLIPFEDCKEETRELFDCLGVVNGRVYTLKDGEKDMRKWTRDKDADNFEDSAFEEIYPFEKFEQIENYSGLTECISEVLETINKDKQKSENVSDVETLIYRVIPINPELDVDEFMIRCYNQTEVFKEEKRREMMYFYMDAALASGGSEAERYWMIYNDLNANRDVCADYN